MKQHMFLGICLGGLLGAGVVQQEAGEYRDPVHHFKISPPVFKMDENARSQTVASFFAPNEQGFSASMNINVQKPGMDLDSFISLSRAQFSTAGLEVLEETRLSVGDRRAVQWLYTGRLHEQDLKFLARAVERGNHIFLITCTALRESFDKYETAFRTSLGSFAFTESR